MKYVTIEAATYAKGDRVIVKFEKDGNYLGTVTRVALDKVYITFDDGDKFSFPATSRKILGKIAKGKRASAISDDNVIKYLIPKVSKEKTTKPSPKKEEKRKKEVKKEKDPPVIPAKLADIFTKVSNNKYPDAKFLRECYEHINKKYFKNELNKPFFRYLKVMPADKMRRHGHWSAKRREIAFNKRIFNASPQQFYDLFIHEVCHQAVTDIDKVNDRTKGGHGSHWVTWMLHCGYKNPQRYVDQEEHMNLMDDKDKKVIEKKQEKQNLIREKINEAEPLSRYTTGTPCKFVDNNGKWLYGKVVTKMVGGRLIVVDTNIRGWRVTNIFDVTPEEKLRIEKEIMPDSVYRIKQNYEKRLAAKREKRSLLDSFRNKFGI